MCSHGAGDFSAGGAGEYCADGVFAIGQTAVVECPGAVGDGDICFASDHGVGAVDDLHQEFVRRAVIVVDHAVDGERVVLGDEVDRAGARVVTDGADGQRGVGRRSSAADDQRFVGAGFNNVVSSVDDSGFEGVIAVAQRSGSGVVKGPVAACAHIGLCHNFAGCVDDLYAHFVASCGDEVAGAANGECAVGGYEVARAKAAVLCDACYGHAAAGGVGVDFTGTCAAVGIAAGVSATLIGVDDKYLGVGIGFDFVACQVNHVNGDGVFTVGQGVSRVVELPVARCVRFDVLGGDYFSCVVFDFY